MPCLSSGLVLSLAGQQVMFSSYHAQLHDMGTVLGALVDTAEDIRGRRRAHGNLACAVMAIIGPESDYAAHCTMDISHGIAANLPEDHLAVDRRGFFRFAVIQTATRPTSGVEHYEWVTDATDVSYARHAPPTMTPSPPW